MKKRIFTFSVFFVFTSFLLPKISNGQQCCVAFDINTGQAWCIANMNPCNVGTTCTGAVLEAAHGLGPGNWVALQCTTPADCSASCTPANTSGLPVELVEFYVKYIDKSIELHWTTASEINNEGFEVERSIDGRNWELLDFVPGNGTTVEFQYYSYMDDHPVLGFNYYRLRQVDFDGAFEYSPVEVAIWQGGSDSNELKLAVLPNPATTWITAALPLTIKKTDDIQFNIYDQIGRLVKTEIIDPESQIRIDLIDLPKGFYILNVIQENFQYSTPFVKR